MTKIREKYPDRNPDQTKICDKHPNWNPDRERRKKEKDAPQSTELPLSRKKGESSTPTKRLTWAAFEEMGKETQADHPPTPSDNINNHTRNRKERASRGGRHINYTIKK